MVEQVGSDRIPIIVPVLIKDSRDKEEEGVREGEVIVERALDSEKESPSAGGVVW